MVRELWLCLSAALCGGCSLILDFSNSAVPVDAEIDGPYTGDECAYLEPNDTLQEPMMVGTGDMGPAAICAPPRDSGLPDDHDFYKFTVPPGTTMVTVTMTHVVRPGGDLDLVLYDPNLAPISSSREFTATERIVCPGSSPFCPAPTAGDYIFEVMPAVVGHVNSYTFTLALQ